MTTSAQVATSALRWEQRVLTRIDVLTGRPRSRTRLALVVFVVAVGTFGPTWLQVPVGSACLALALVYGSAFVVNVVREFIEGYRGR